MTTKAAEDYESIARHLKELEAEKQLALTGSSAAVKVGEYAMECPVRIGWAAPIYEWREDLPQIK